MLPDPGHLLTLLNLWSRNGSLVGVGGALPGCLLSVDDGGLLLLHGLPGLLGGGVEHDLAQGRGGGSWSVVGKGE